VMVCFNFVTHQPIVMPQEWRTAIEQFEKQFAG
jgi:acyl-CoA thioesterase FadM